MRLHPDPAALWALPLSFLVVYVPLQFLHLNSTGLARHRFDDRISVAEAREACASSVRYDRRGVLVQARWPVLDFSRLHGLAARQRLSYDRIRIQ